MVRRKQANKLVTIEFNINSMEMQNKAELALRAEELALGVFNFKERIPKEGEFNRSEIWAMLYEHVDYGLLELLT